MTRSKRKPPAEVKPEQLDVELAAMPPAPDPVTRAIYLLEYARRYGFRIGPTLVVGDLTVQVEDIWQARRERDGDRGPRDVDAYTEAGAVEEPADGTAG